jgi:exopolyphosphatase/guanosine-5'-triphosphate,3'-diphosphate pyrophosphatase
MRLAAIDIGSNAARLLITEVIQNNGKPQFNKLNLVRVPLRLGFDVFERNEISPEIEVITGDMEATLIYENHIAENMDTDHSYLYIDVGGGSTELTFFAENRLVFKRSFNIGTIRLLKEQVEESQWEEMKEFIKTGLRGHDNDVIAIGSGGNINKVFSLSKRKEGKPLTFDLLKDYHKELSNFSVEDRIRLYKLREDRADVIVPALLIYLNVMRWANAQEIYVPKIGLADGLAQHLYEEMREKNVQ